VKEVYWVALKEILSTWRDKRTIRNVLIMPLLLMPLFMYGPTVLLSKLQTHSQESLQRVAVCDLPELLRQEIKKVKLEPVVVDSPRSAVLSESVDAALCRQGDEYVIYAEESAKPIKIGFVVAKLQRALDEYKQQLIAAKLRQAGLSAADLHPFKVVKKDLSPSQARSYGILGGMTPYFLMLFIMMGAMAVVIDATAGEKERGTLEILLAAPVAHVKIAAGKLLAGLFFAVLTSVSGLTGLTIGAYYSKSAVKGDELAMIGGGLSMTAADFVTLLVTALLFAAEITALLLAVGMYARSYKEAQTYISPLYMALIIPMLLLMFAADYLQGSIYLYAIPVFNVYLAIDQIIKGQSQFLPLLICWISTALAVLAALYWAARNFSSEAVIFRN